VVDCRPSVSVTPQGSSQIVANPYTPSTNISIMVWMKFYASDTGPTSAILPIAYAGNHLDTAGSPVQLYFLLLSSHPLPFPFIPGGALVFGVRLSTSQLVCFVNSSSISIPYRHWRHRFVFNLLCPCSYLLILFCFADGRLWPVQYNSLVLGRFISTELQQPLRLHLLSSHVCL
jgi:hypothetical protein